VPYAEGGPSALDEFLEQGRQLPPMVGTVDHVPWERCIDAGPNAPAPLYVDLNDRHLLVDVAVPSLSDRGHDRNRAAQLVASTSVWALVPTATKGPVQPAAAAGADGDTYVDVDTVLNMSNDRFYSEGKQKRTERVRYGTSELTLRHARPALRLEYPLVRAMT
jgi:hypothetical protein